MRTTQKETKPRIAAEVDGHDAPTTSSDPRDSEPGTVGGSGEGDVGQPDASPEVRSGRSASAGAASVETLINEGAGRLAAGESTFDVADWVLAQGAEQKLAPGGMAYLRQKLAKMTGLGSQVLTQIQADRSNTDANGQVLHTTDRVAAATVSELSESYSTMVWDEGHLWTYKKEMGEGSPDTGFFERHSPSDLNDWVLESYGAFPSASRDRQRKDVIQRVAAALKCPEFFRDARKGMNLSNGFVCYDPTRKDLKLIKTCSAHKARWRLMRRFDRRAQAPTLLRGLERTFPDATAIEAFREFFGCALLGETPRLDDARHALMLVGPRKGGKSTLLELLRKLVPSEVVTAIPPSQWSDPYYRAMLSGAAINAVTELGDGKLVSGDYAKAIIGHDVVNARLPYGRPFDFRPRAYHVFATNTVPRTDDTDPAFRRRFLAIRLDRTLRPEEVDPDFLTKVEAELEGVIAWLLTGAVNALRRGNFVCPAGHREIMAEMQHGSDLAARFVITMVEGAAETERALSTKDLNAALKAFALREGIPTEDWAPTTSARRIADLLKSIYDATQVKIQGVPHYRGVRLKSLG